MDRVTVFQFDPSPEVAALAERSGMSDHGRFMYYAGTPLLLDGESFSKSCTNNQESSVILGCYSNGAIYIFNVDDPRLNGVEEVTAAHEMLHVAYDRMSGPERDSVNRLVETTLESIELDTELAERLEIYEKTEPGQRNNELFAIFGTEFSNVEPGLEKIYDNYFDDRSKVVALSNTYNDVFVSLKTQAEDIRTRIMSIVSQRNSLIETYNKDYRALQDEIQDYNSRKSSMTITQARNEAFRLNNRVAELNTRYETINSQVELMDEQVEQLQAQFEKVNVTQLELRSSLDSRLEPSVEPAG